MWAAGAAIDKTLVRFEDGPDLVRDEGALVIEAEALSEFAVEDNVGPQPALVVGGSGIHKIRVQSAEVEASEPGIGHCLYGIGHDLREDLPQVGLKGEADPAPAVLAEAYLESVALRGIGQARCQ